MVGITLGIIIGRSRGKRTGEEVLRVLAGEKPLHAVNPGALEKRASRGPNR